MDVCLHVMLTPANHALPQDKADRRLSGGDIIDIFPASAVGTLISNDYMPNDVIGSHRLGFVFIKDVPISVLNKARQALIKSHKSVTPEDNVQLLLRRIWGIDVQSVPVAARNKLLADRYITVTWLQAKSYIKNKVTATNLSDGDVV